MDKETRIKLLNKKMTRREFLQFTGSSLLVLFGIANIVAVVNHAKQTVEPAVQPAEKAQTGFGAKRFGV